MATTASGEYIAALKTNMICRVHAVMYNVSCTKTVLGRRLRVSINRRPLKPILTSKHSRVREPTNSTKTTVTTEFNEIWKVAQQTTEIGYTRDLMVNYFYDISGNMLRESDDAHQDQYYYYGSNGLTCIYDSKLGVKHSYIRAGLQLLSSSDGFYYIVNGRGDVVALVSNRAATYYNSGDIIGYYVYEPFGGLRAAQKQRTVFNKFKFAGGLQSNTGNYAFGSRIYAPGQGRWISMDAYQGSVNDPLSLNRYAYCSNDPVNFVDPSGYFALAAVPYVLKAMTLGGAALYTWINANLPIITQYLYLFGDKIAGIVHDLCNSNSSSAGSPGDQRWKAYPSNDSIANRKTNRHVKANNT